MNFLAGGHGLKNPEKKKKVVISSDEYEESDEEPPKQPSKAKSPSPSTDKEETFVVQSIVDHREVFYVGFKSALPYQFKVRWLNYGPEDDTYEPIENFSSGTAKLLTEYCQRNSIHLPENYVDFMTQVDTSSDDDNTNDSPEKNKEKLKEEEEIRRKAKEKKKERKEEKSRMKDRDRSQSLPSLFNDEQPSTSKDSDALMKNKEKKSKVKLNEEERLKRKEEKRRKKMEEAKRAEEKEKREREERKMEEEKRSEEKKKEMKDKLKREAEEERKLLMETIKKNEEETKIKNIELEKKKKDEEMKKKKEKEDEEERKRMKVGKAKASSITMDELFGTDKSDKDKEKEKPKVNELKTKLKSCDLNEKKKSEKKIEKNIEIKKNIEVTKDEKEKKKDDIEEKKKEDKKKDKDKNKKDIESVTVGKKSGTEFKKNIEITKDEKEKKKVVIEEKKMDKDKNKKDIEDKKKEEKKVDKDKKKNIESVMVGKKSGKIEEKTSVPKVSPTALRTPNLIAQQSSHYELMKRQKMNKIKEKDEEKKKEEEKEKEVKLKDKEKKRKKKKDEEKKIKKISKNIITNRKIKITRHSLRKLKESRRAKETAKNSLRVQSRIDRMKRIRQRREKAFSIIRSRLLEFSKKDNEAKKELMKKEIEWRNRMIKEGKMKSIKMINDTIDIIDENCVKDASRIRTLRRCKSAERCHNSYRPLSSIYSMETLPTCSLYSALDLGLTLEERKNNREIINKRVNDKCIKMKKDEEEEKKESKSEDRDSLHLAVNKFTHELIPLAEKLAPGMYSESEITIHSIRGIQAYLSLSVLDITNVLDGIHCHQYRNEYIVRLIRLLSSQINLAIPDSPLRDSCDDGTHRKCSMLITLLMALPEPIRYGKGSNCLLPLNTLYDALSMCAPCQIRAFIRGGCTFDEWIDTDGSHAGHKALRECSINMISWLIERGLDVNSIVVPKDGKAIQNDIYIKPYKLYKQSSITVSSLCQHHSSRLSLRSSAWTRSLLSLFNIFPITNCHSLNPFSPLHRHLSVTFCDENEFDKKCRIVLAVHSVTINKGDGLIKYEENKNIKKKKKNDTPLQDIFIPFFTIERSKNIKCDNIELNETFNVNKVRIIVPDLSDRKNRIEIELERWKWNEATAIFKVPLKYTKYMLSHGRLIEVWIGISSPPEHTVLLSQLFAVVPY